MSQILDYTKSSCAEATDRWRIVYIIDDDSAVRKSLHYSLSVDRVRVWPFGEAADFLEQVEDLQPAPILLDYRMPGIDGMQLLEALRERSIDWPAIMMTAHGDVPVAVEAMKLGAVDFLEKPFDLKDLQNALGHAFAKVREVLIKTELVNEAREKIAKLTSRELEVMRCAARGMQNKSISEALGISRRTVETHRAAAMQKFEVKGVSNAMRIMAAAKEF